MGSARRSFIGLLLICICMIVGYLNLQNDHIYSSPVHYIQQKYFSNAEPIRELSRDRGSACKVSAKRLAEQTRKNAIDAGRILCWNETKSTMNRLVLDGASTTNNADRIVFIRVPKCGTRSALDLFNYLANSNQYNMINSIVYGPFHLRKENMNLIKSVILRATPPFVLERQMHFIDLGKSSGVKYFSIIRDPIERFVSLYYFNRFGDASNDRQRFIGTTERKYETINECVLNGSSECNRNMEGILSFFCGHSPKCSDSSLKLEMAKTNVERDFLMVGLLEQNKDTFAVLEALRPRLFKGALDYVIESENKVKERYITNSKVLPTEEVRQILFERMSSEYKLYDYIKQRFNNQMATLGVRHVD